MQRYKSKLEAKGIDSSANIEYFGLYLYTPTFYANLIARASYQDTGYVSTIPLVNNQIPTASFGAMSNMKPSGKTYGFEIDPTRDVVTGNQRTQFSEDYTRATLRATLMGNTNIEGQGDWKTT